MEETRNDVERSPSKTDRTTKHGSGVMDDVTRTDSRIPTDTSGDPVARRDNRNNPNPTENKVNCCCGGCFAAIIAIWLGKKL